MSAHMHKDSPPSMMWKAMQNTGIFVNQQDIPVWNNQAVVNMESSPQSHVPPWVVGGGLSHTWWFFSPVIPGYINPLKMYSFLGKSSPIFQLPVEISLGPSAAASLQLSSLYMVNKSCEQQSPISH